MLKNTQHNDQESKAASQHPWKYCLVPKHEPRGKFRDKENNSNPQLKSSIHPHRKKAENNGVSASETFATYSKVHLACLSKFHTLFLAFHLYEMAIENQSLKNIPHSYKSLCCMFLAMKYEEIYPVELAELAKFMKVTYHLDDYRRYQKAILMSVGLDLDVQTIDRTLEGIFSELRYDKVEEMKSFFFLQLAFVSPNLYKQFKEEDILRAVTKLVRRQGLLDDDSLSKGDLEDNKIMRLLLEAKMSDRALEGLIQRKYTKQKYENAAILPI